MTDQAEQYRQYDLTHSQYILLEALHFFFSHNSHAEFYEVIKVLAHQRGGLLSDPKAKKDYQILGNVSEEMIAKAKAA